MATMESNSTKAPMFYDVYRTSDQKVVAVGIPAKQAAKMADVTESFVIASAKQHARNAYGRVATVTGFYFTLHLQDPHTSQHVQEAPKGRDRWRPPRLAVASPHIYYKLNSKRLIKYARESGYDSITDLCRQCSVPRKLVYEYVRGSHGHGVMRIPKDREEFLRICVAVNRRPEELFDKVLWPEPEQNNDY